MKHYARRIVALVFCFLCINCLFASTSQAQLPRDVRDMFEAMLDDLDSDLKEKFEKAIADNTATVNFSPDEFRRFRENPVNPFEGLDRIEAKDGAGTISLKFELPSIRNRVVGDDERQANQQLTELKPTIKSVVPSVVGVMANGRQIALGTVVDGNGHVVSKLSEVKDKKYLTLVSSSGQEFAATVDHEDDENDLAILKVDTTDLSPIDWQTYEPDAGSFLLTPAPNATVVSIGTYSVTPRSTRSGQRAQLGVNPDDSPDGRGVIIDEIGPPEAGELPSAAFTAGLQDGDIITRLAGKPTVDVTALVNAIREKRPGDSVRIEYLRGSRTLETQATLSGIDVSGERAKRYKMMSRLGAIPSRRSDNFPYVFQHDGPIFPEQCGGPVVDLDGNVIGINIARNGRASTYAIPLDRVQKIVSEYLRDAVASKR